MLAGSQRSGTILFFGEARPFHPSHWLPQRRRYRLGVRTEDSQSSNPGSIPGSATKTLLSYLFPIASSLSSRACQGCVTALARFLNSLRPLHEGEAEEVKQLCGGGRRCHSLYHNPAAQPISTVLRRGEVENPDNLTSAALVNPWKRYHGRSRNSPSAFIAYKSTREL
jgi:hypothetical protein